MPEHRIEPDAAGAIILDMDTPGGRLDAAEEIISLITSAKAPTFTLVNPNAISAGAIIAMATDHIYMTPGGRIGDAIEPVLSPCLILARRPCAQHIQVGVKLLAVGIDDHRSSLRSHFQRAP